VDSARKEQRCVDVYAKEFLCRRQVAVLVEIEAQRACLLLDERLLVSAPQGQSEWFHGSLNLVTHVKAKTTARPCFHLRIR